MQKEENKISLDDKIIKWISKNLFYSFLILLSIIIIVLLIVFFITACFYKDKTILNPNEIGDAIGGLTAPIIGLFSAFLVYIAFREQVKANKELENFNKTQLKISNFNNDNKIIDEIFKELKNVNSRFYSINQLFYYLLNENSTIDELIIANDYIKIINGIMHKLNDKSHEKEHILFLKHKINFAINYNTFKGNLSGIHFEIKGDLAQIERSRKRRELVTTLNQFRSYFMSEEK